jgi:hypothetical protein
VWSDQITTRIFEVLELIFPPDFLEKKNWRERIPWTPYQSLLPPASHGAEVGPCALYGDMPLLETTLDCIPHCIPHGDKGVTASPRQGVKRQWSSRTFRLMLQGPERDLCWIINMDQMPVFFSMHPKKHLRFLARKPFLSGPQGTPQGVLPLR